MKICFYCDTLFTFGGVQRVLASIAGALSSHHEVTLLTLDDPSLEDATLYELNHTNVHFDYLRLPPLSGVEYLPCKTYSYLYKTILPKTRATSKLYSYSSFPASQRHPLIERLNAGGYDVIVGVHAFLSLRLAAIREQLQARLVMGWLHTSYDAFFNTPGFYLWQQRVQFEHDMKRLDRVVVLSKTDSERYLKEMGLKTSTIYNPLTIKAHGRGKWEYRRFLAVGRLSHQTKGFDLLIEAFARFAESNSEWALDIVGEGPEEALLRALIAQHGLEQRVLLHPFTKQVQQHYATASCFVMSSRWEGFSLVLGEAMAHGLPLIASSLPVVKELLGNKEHALIFENKEVESLTRCMEQVAALDAETWQRLSALSVAEAESFAMPAVIEQWESILGKTDEKTDGKP